MMIVVLKPGVTPEKKNELVRWLEEMGVSANCIDGEFQTAIGLVGDASRLDVDQISALDAVEKVFRVTEPYRLCGRREHPEDRCVKVGEAAFGAGHFAVIAGPCSVESEEQIVGIAKAVKAAGADLLRGGAFKPRTSPYDFSGLKAAGLEMLRVARAETGLPVVSELMSIRDLELFDSVDMIQIGARNMQNFELLRELGKVGKPILLKRGMACTLRELLLSAEHILAGGNEQVVLCERGIRTFSDNTRNTLDLSAVPMLREMSCLPVIVDPSHGTGRAGLVPPMALAGTAAGADGLMIEVHNEPVEALCDGAQAMKPEAFAALMGKVRRIREIVES